MGFWDSRTGAPIDGSPESSHTGDFTVIPNGTSAPASIKSFLLVEKKNPRTQVEENFYQITYKITSGEFKNREVTQKIKVFEDKPETVQRALNMMKRVYDLCNHKPAHANVPTNDDLKPMIGKILGIKIREWQIAKDDGGFMEGNFVAEVYSPSQDFKTETGIKLSLPEVITSHVNSAFSRNPRVEPDLDSDLPF